MLLSAEDLLIQWIPFPHDVKLYLKHISLYMRVWWILAVCWLLELFSQKVPHFHFNMTITIVFGECCSCHWYVMMVSLSWNSSLLCIGEIYTYCCYCYLYCHCWYVYNYMYICIFYIVRQQKLWHRFDGSHWLEFSHSDEAIWTSYCFHCFFIIYISIWNFSNIS